MHYVITNLFEIGPVVLEKKILENVNVYLLRFEKDVALNYLNNLEFSSLKYAL